MNATEHEDGAFQTDAGVWIVECGSCGLYHREAFWGDCRDDSERIVDPDNGQAANGNFPGR